MVGKQLSCLNSKTIVLNKRCGNVGGRHFKYKESMKLKMIFFLMVYINQYFISK